MPYPPPNPLAEIRTDIACPISGPPHRGEHFYGKRRRFFRGFRHIHPSVFTGVMKLDRDSLRA